VRIETALILLSHLRPKTLTFVEIGIDGTLMAEIICNDRVDLTQLQRWILLRDFLRGRPFPESSDDCIEGHARLADAHNAIPISHQRGFLGGHFQRHVWLLVRITANGL